MPPLKPVLRKRLPSRIRKKFPVKPVRGPGAKAARPVAQRLALVHRW